MLLFPDQSQCTVRLVVLFLLPPTHVPYEASHSHKDSASEDVRLCWSCLVRDRSDPIRNRLPLGRWCTFHILRCSRLGRLTNHQVYPWTSARVLSTLLIGVAILVAFVLWELYAPIQEPLVPMKLFKNVHWVAACVLLGLGARSVKNCSFGPFHAETDKK